MIARKSKHEYRVEIPTKKSYTNDDLYEIIHWCTQTFGEGGRNQKCRWRYGWIKTDIFYFRNEKDAMYFVLRWS